MAIEPNPGNNKAIKELLDNLDDFKNGETNHEALNGLLGGNSSGHYHLTEALLNKLNNLSESGNQNHEELSGLLGGNSSGHYHLTKTLLDKLKNLSDSENQNHEDLSGLLGGNNSGHYHLTQNELDKLRNIQDGGGGSDGEAKPYRLVKEFFANFGGNVNTTNSQEPSDDWQNNFDFTVPEGVNRINISGSAGGGGLYTNGTVIQSGWSGGQSPGGYYDVKPNDNLHISVGLGGAMNCTGQDTVVTLNGIEIFRLLGGASKNHDAYTPSEYGGIANPPKPFYWELWYSCSPTPDAVNDAINLAHSANIYNDDLLSFLLNSMLSPRTLFPPFGEGGCLLSDNRRRIRDNSGFEGKGGVVIFEYVQQLS